MYSWFIYVVCQYPPLPPTHTHMPTQLGYGDLTPYGHPTSNTPHIQLLAEQGLVFTQFYTTSPVCSLSRAALLTGQYQTIGPGYNPGVFEPNNLGGKMKDHGDYLWLLFQTYIFM